MLFRFWRRHGRLLPAKRALIARAFTSLPIRTFADLGGVWGVDGGYTFDTLKRYPTTTATLVDTHFTKSVEQRAEREPRLRLIRGSFGDQATVEQVGPVDAVFLFDVLLHQVAPDWDSILERYAERARYLLIYNQQWVGSGRRRRLLDMGEDEYFRNVPHARDEAPYDGLFAKLNDIHADHGKPWRDVHHIWQWGLTDADLEEKAELLGFRLLEKKNYGRFGSLENFENHSFLFARSRQAEG